MPIIGLYILLFLSFTQPSQSTQGSIAPGRIEHPPHARDRSNMTSFKQKVDEHRRRNTVALVIREMVKRSSPKSRKRGSYASILEHDASKEEDILTNFTNKWTVVRRGLKRLKKNISLTLDDLTEMEKNMTSLIRKGDKLADVSISPHNSTKQLIGAERRLRAFLKDVDSRVPDLEEEVFVRSDIVDGVMEEVLTVGNVLAKQWAYQNGKEEAELLFEVPDKPGEDDLPTHGAHLKKQGYMGMVEGYLRAAVSGFNMNDARHIEGMTDVLEPGDDPDLVRADRLIDKALSYRSRRSTHFLRERGGSKRPDKTNSKDDFSRPHAFLLDDIQTVPHSHDMAKDNLRIVKNKINIGTNGQQDSSYASVDNYYITPGEGVPLTNDGSDFDNINHQNLGISLNLKRKRNIRKKRDARVTDLMYKNDEKAIRDFLDNTSPTEARFKLSNPFHVATAQRGKNNNINDLVKDYFNEVRKGDKMDRDLKPVYDDRRDNDLEHTLNRLQHLKNRLKWKASHLVGGGGNSYQINELMKKTEDSLGSASKTILKQKLEKQMEQVDRSRNIAETMQGDVETNLLNQLELLSMRVNDLKAAARARETMRPIKKSLQRRISRKLKKNRKKFKKFIKKHNKQAFRRMMNYRIATGTNGDRAGFFRGEMGTFKKALRKASRDKDPLRKKMKILMLQYNLENMLQKREGMVDPGGFLGYWGEGEGVDPEDVYLPQAERTPLFGNK